MTFRRTVIADGEVIGSIIPTCIVLLYRTVLVDGQGAAGGQQIVAADGQYQLRGVPLVQVQHDPLHSGHGSEVRDRGQRSENRGRMTQGSRRKHRAGGGWPTVNVANITRKFEVK